LLTLIACGATLLACSSSDDTNSQWPSTNSGGSGSDSSSGGTTSYGAASGNGGASNGGAAAAFGFWNRIESEYGYETDIAYGGIDGESSDRVFMCEWNSPSAGLYKGRLVKPDMIRWDSEHRLPEYKVVFPNKDRMSFIPQTGTNEFLGKYAPGTWRKGSCGLELQGGKVVDPSKPVPAPFTVSVDTAFTETTPGASVTLSVSVTREAEFSAPITLNVEGLPEGGTVTPATIAVTDTKAQLNIKLPDALKTGPTILAVRGEGDGRTARAGHAVVVKSTAVVYERRKSIAIGGRSHSTLLLKGDGALYAWGGNDYGQLGVPQRNNYQELSPIAVATELRFSLVASGNRNTCALDAQGKAYCWGSQWAGQVGDGVWATNPSSAHPLTATPVPVQGDHTFATISVGNDFTCALDTQGKAWCWGENLDGRLGDGTTTDRATPVAVKGDHTFVTISAGESHACALTYRGEAYCWGFDSGGQLGTGRTAATATSSAVSEPARVLGGITFASLSVGAESYTCGLTPAGKAYCWGTKHPALGNENMQYPDYNQPFPLAADLTFQRLETGRNTACGLTTTRTLYCWGDSTYGQAGDGTQETYWGPKNPVKGDHQFAEFDLGSTHVCATDTAGKVWCWGGNTAGQLGLNILSSSYYTKEALEVPITVE
jgi:alpha-tubulin suppressor-like RCC1 family protein